MGVFIKSSKLLKLRSVSTCSVRGHQVEVMVSQSNNLMANTALEEWIRRSNSLKHRNLLLLSSNLIHKGQSIKAFFRRNQSSNTGYDDDFELLQQADLVLSSLPRNAPLVRLPEVRVEDGHNGISISVPLEEHENQEFISGTLQSIADSVVEKNIQQEEHRSVIHATRISLVRPDKGWFPGIQDIQKDIEFNIKEIEEIRRSRLLEGNPKPY